MSSLAQTMLTPTASDFWLFGQAPVTDSLSANAEAASELVGQAAAGIWAPIMLALIGLAAVGYCLLQHGVVKSNTLTSLGVAMIFAAVLLGISLVTPGWETYLLLSFCAVAVAGGVGFLVAREPVYAALGFATAVLSVCGILFMMSALFIAAATMIVYAGATIIIFLFVLMFAQQTHLRAYDIQLSNPILAAAVGAVLMVTIGICTTSDGQLLPRRDDLTRPYSMTVIPESLRSEQAAEAIRSQAAKDRDAQVISGSTAGLGRSLYTDYLIAVELAGTILLVATIGAIALAQRPAEGAA